MLYLIIAFSFSVSSVFFIHRRAMGMFNIPNSLIKDILYIILVTIAFPIILLAWLLDSEKFIKIYGESYSKL